MTAETESVCERRLLLVRKCLEVQIAGIEKNLDPFTKEIILANLKEILEIFDEDFV